MPACPGCSPPVVVADVDTGIDDALALTYLAHLHKHGDIILRVTTSAGNCTATQAAANSAEVLRMCGVDLPVYAGAAAPLEFPLVTTPETHGPTGLGHHRTRLSSRDFCASVARAVATWEGADVILVAGPSTNLAWAIEHMPHVLNGAQVCVMGGAFHYPGNTTPTAEWNAWVDPHALQRVLNGRAPDDRPLDGQALADHDGGNLATVSGALPVICPLNVTERVVLTPQRLELMELPRWMGENSRVLEDALRFYFEFHQQVGVGYVAQIHDLAAAMVALEQSGAVLADRRGIQVGSRCVAATVEAETQSDLLRGTTVADYVGGTPQGQSRSGADSGACDRMSLDAQDLAAVGPYWGRPANALIVAELDPEAVFREFQRVVCC